MSPKLLAIADDYQADLGRVCARLADAETELDAMRPLVEAAMEMPYFYEHPRCTGIVRAYRAAIARARD